MPTRGAKAGEDPSAAGGGGGGGAAASLADLMPRNDISGQITSGLIAELADKQWKVSVVRFISSKIAVVLCESHC